MPWEFGPGVAAKAHGDGFRPPGVAAKAHRDGFRPPGVAVTDTESDARQLREATARLIRILATHDEDQAAEAINALLDEYPAQPCLVRLPGRPWSLHTKAPHDADPTHWLLSTTGLALGLRLSERGRCA